MTKKKLIIVIISSLIIVAGLGGGVYFLAFNNPAPDSSSNSNSSNPNPNSNDFAQNDFPDNNTGKGKIAAPGDNSVNAEQYNNQVIADLEKSRQAAIDRGDNELAQKIQSSIDKLRAKSQPDQPASAPIVERSGGGN